MPRMTIDEIMTSEKLMLTLTEVQGVLGISAERLTAQARKDPEKLGFPVVVACDTVRIPRRPLLKWLGIEEKEGGKDEADDHGEQVGN